MSCFICNGDNKQSKYECIKCQKDICIDCLKQIKKLKNHNDNIILEFKCPFCRNCNLINFKDTLDIFYIIQQDLKDLIFYKSHYQLLKKQNKILENQIEELYLEKHLETYQLEKICLTY